LEYLALEPTVTQFVYEKRHHADFFDVTLGQYVL